MDYSGITQDEQLERGTANAEIYRDETYYFENVIFLVENCLFKVPRRFFVQESEFFRLMFQLHPPQSHNVDGLTDEQPVRLDGVDKRDFRQLVRLLYSDRSAFHENEQFTLEEWASILKLSTMWDMTDVRDHAITQMTPLLASNAARQVALGQEYHVDAWIMNGVTALSRRSPPMGREEVNLLGIDNVLKIAAIRECIYRSQFGWTLNRERGHAPSMLPTVDALVQRIRESFFTTEGSQ